MTHSAIKIHAKPLSLRLRRPFSLSHGTSTFRDNVLVEIYEADGQTGLGEAAIVPYYQESTQSVLAYINQPAVEVLLDSGIAALDDAPEDPQPVLEDLLACLPSPISTAGRTALEMALFDRWGRIRGHPLFKLWGLDPSHAPSSSFTIALECDEQSLCQQIRDLKHRGPIKLKLGSGNVEEDLRIVRLARRETRAPLCVDVNGGWNVDEARWIMPRLLPYQLQFIEQPVSANDWEGWSGLRDIQRPLLLADESAQNLKSLERLEGLADGVNIKLVKCGGIGPARRMVVRAQQLKMRVLIGCMIESSIAVTAAAHLAPLADFADLDGNMLITNDPFRGVKIEAGAIELPLVPGLGLVKKADISS